MKLQSQFAHKYKNKIHYKYVIIIPEGTIEKLGWESGRELKEFIEDGKLIIRPLTKEERGEKMMKKIKMSYEEFKDIIKKELKSEPKGLTWMEIRKRGGLKQKIPNNKWVRMLDKDIGLIRKRIKGKTIWRLR